MIRSTRWAAALALASLLTGGVGADDPRLVRRTLDNGLELILLPDAGRLQDRVWGTLFVRGGEALEAPGREGLCELLCACLVEGGSAATKGQDLIAWLDAQRASIGPNVGYDSLRIDFSAPKENAGALLERLRDLVRAPLIPEALVGERRSLLIDQVTEPEDPAIVIERLALGPDTRAGKKPTVRSLWSLAREDLLAFHQANFGTNRMVLGLCGAFDANELSSSITGLFGVLPKVAALPERVAPAVRAGKPKQVYVMTTPPEESALVSVIGRGPAPTESDFALLELWNDVASLALIDPERVEKQRASGLLGVPRAAFESSPLGFGSYRAEVETLAPSTAGAIAACLEPIAPTSLAKLTQAALEQAWRERRTNVAADAPTDRAVLEEALRRAIVGEIVAPALAAAPGPGDVAAAVQRWVTPESTWLLATGTLGLLAEPLDEEREILVLDPTNTVGSTFAGLAAAGRMFEALGGRERWADLRSVHTEGEFVVQESDRIATRQWRDMIALRLRQEQVRGASTEIVVVSPRGGWTRGGNTVTSMPPELQARTLLHMEAHLFQVLRDLAVGASRGVRVASDGMLEIATPAGPLCWIELDAEGRPARSGWRPEGKWEGRLFQYEDWTTTDGYPWPRRVLQPEQKWVSTTSVMRVNPVLDGELFARGN